MIKEIGFDIILGVIIAIACGTMGGLQISFFSWQFWMILIAIIGANVCGRFTPFDNKKQ